MANVDTDRIIPARFLRRPRSEGYGQYAFHDLRFDASGEPNPSFVLNEERYRSARILVASANFGCGSSRETAVWALHDLKNSDFYFRVVIAPSFGDIFYNNCGKNGLLAVRLPESDVAQLQQDLLATEGAKIRVDLEEQVVTTPSGARLGFEIDAFRKHCLLAGLDDIDVTMEHESEISDFEQKRRSVVPWVLG